MENTEKCGDCKCNQWGTCYGMPPREQVPCARARVPERQAEGRGRRARVQPVREEGGEAVTPEELRKMADGYREKADKHLEDCQADGRLRDRDAGLAEAPYAAADAEQTANSLSLLRFLVLGLNPAGNSELEKIQGWIRKGEL